MEQNPHYEDTLGYNDDADRFLRASKLFVIGSYNNRRPDEEPDLRIDQLYIVTFAYILGNYKAMISTSIAGDGLYFEVTHNAEKDETYVDTYKKLYNDKFSDDNTIVDDQKTADQELDLDFNEIVTFNPDNHHIINNQ